jgi:hypothetical protein
MTVMNVSRPFTRRIALLGIGLLAASVCGVRAGSAADEPDFIPSATIVEVMDSMLMPSAQVLWDAVAVNVTEEGVVKQAPETDEDWQRLRFSAVTLAEATNVLMIPGREVAPPGTESEYPDVELGPEQIEALIDADRAAWDAHARVLHETAMQAVRAIDDRDVDALFDVGGAIDAACESCHTQFWYPEQ